MTLLLKHKGRIVAKVDESDLSYTCPPCKDRMAKSAIMVHYAHRLDVEVKNNFGMHYSWEAFR